MIFLVTYSFITKVFEITVFLKAGNNTSTCVTLCRPAQIWT